MVLALHAYTLKLITSLTKACMRNFFLAIIYIMTTEVSQVNTGEEIIMHWLHVAT